MNTEKTQKKQKKKRRLPLRQRIKFYVNKYRLAHKQAGICPCCPERLDINPRTGRYYSLGPLCRGKKAATQKVLMQRRRAEGKN